MRHYRLVDESVAYIAIFAASIIAAATMPCNVNLLLPCRSPNTYITMERVSRSPNRPSAASIAPRLTGCFRK